MHARKRTRCKLDFDMQNAAWWGGRTWIWNWKGLVLSYCTTPEVQRSTQGRIILICWLRKCVRLYSTWNIYWGTAKSGNWSERCPNHKKFVLESDGKYGKHTSWWETEQQRGDMSGWTPGLYFVCSFIQFVIECYFEESVVDWQIKINGLPIKDLDTKESSVRNWNWVGNR